MWKARTDKWYLERIIWLIAGSVVLGGIALGIMVHPYWFILPCLAGFNMIVFSFTGFCPMAILLNSLGVQPLDSSQGTDQGAPGPKA